MARVLERVCVPIVLYWGCLGHSKGVGHPGVDRTHLRQIPHYEVSGWFLDPKHRGLHARKEHGQVVQSFLDP